MPKCVLVPLGVPFSIETAMEMKTWLVNVLPSWQDMTVADRREYFGALLGPAAAINDAWQAAGGKWVFRALELAAIDCPAHISTHLYSTRVLPAPG